MPGLMIMEAYSISANLKITDILTDTEVDPAFIMK